ncbi:DUF4180 domain-containing protein [Phyllobacterium sp. YR531]|uniref:DUF4180 domain-containing protein n=1 Tax=Phyllobacterium sp. YR531 TaxID=1144343 RepID=UPI00026F7601|nr:DUF4180 domain-containing protein [Phyllobacterium sp. YR531]EJM98889.1 hypothetical protein PMI41_04651 [Phyllobacterium sp. YR531]
MNEIVEIGNQRVLRFAKDGALLQLPSDANDFLGDAWSVEATVLAIPVERLGPDFLKLETRIAGEVFQKFANYHMTCAIIGDITTALERSNAFRDFVRETNKGKALWFLTEFDQLNARLSS